MQILYLMIIRKYNQRGNFGNLLRILFQVIYVLKIPKLSGGLWNARIKRVEFGNFSPLNSCGDRCFKFSYTYLARSGSTIACGSWLATFFRYRKSWFSIIVKSRQRNFGTPVVIRRNCNKLSGDRCASDPPSTKIIQSFSKTAELLSAITEVLYKLMPVTRDREICYSEMRQTSH